MLGAIGAKYHSSEIWARVTDFFIVWMGTFVVVWPAKACGKICDKRSEVTWSQYFISCGFSLPWSLLASGVAFLLSWFGHRYTIVFYVAAGVLVPLLLCAACGLFNKLCVRAGVVDS